MPPTLPGSADASNIYEDLSGVNSTTAFCNPYDALIEACHDDSVCLDPILCLSKHSMGCDEKLDSHSFLPAI
jgi:hypothetical protein